MVLSKNHLDLGVCESLSVNVSHFRVTLNACVHINEHQCQCVSMDITASVDVPVQC